MAIVLLVDPSQTIRRVVEMVFKGSGHDVIAATTAADGRQALVRYQPAVVLINYLLPDGSGVQLCQALKENASTAHIPIVVLGGRYAPFDEGEAQAAGADTVVMKPFDTDGLYEPVMGLIEDQPTRPSAAPAPVAPAQAAVAPVQQPAARSEIPRYAPPSQRQPVPPRQATPARPATQPRQAGSQAAAAAPRVASRPASGARPAPAHRPTTGVRPRPGYQQEPQPEEAPAYKAETIPTPDVRGADQAPRALGPAQYSAPPTSIEIDEDKLREIVEDLLPQIAINSLQQMLADWLEARLRNYIYELVQQELSRYR